MVAANPRTKVGPRPIDLAQFHVAASTHPTPSRPEVSETLQSPIQGESLPQQRFIEAKGHNTPGVQILKTSVVVPTNQPSTSVDAAEQGPHEKTPDAASVLPTAPETAQAESVSSCSMVDKPAHPGVEPSEKGVAAAESTEAVQEIAMRDPSDMDLVAPDEDVIDLFETAVAEEGKSVEEVEAPVPYKLAISFGDKETEITLLMHSDHAEFIERSIEETSRCVEARPVMHDEITQCLYPMYEEVLDTGFADPGEDVLEMAELADYLFEVEMFLTIKIGWAMLMLYPSRPNVEDEEAEADDVTIGFEFRAIPEDQRAEINTEDPAYDDAEDILWTDIESDDEDLDEDDVLNNLADKSFSELFNVEFEDLFTWPTQTQGIMKEVFLLLESDREAEMQALSKLLQWNGAHVSIPEHDEDDPDPDNYTWQEFKELGEGVVILDSRITAYRDVEFLSYLLFSRFNVFELNTSGQELELRPLFENGHTLFLTDQVLEEQPTMVLEVVNHVKERNKSKMSGSESRRIFARPGVVGWLQELCEEVGDDVSKAQPYYTLSQELNSLVPIDSPRDAFELTDRVLYEPPWLDAHSQTYKHDPMVATKALVSAFDLTFCQHREMSRNWIVLHPTSTFPVKVVEQLSEEFCNLHFMSVEDYISKAMNKAMG